mmetsp:Transcript_35257/g.77021  ORF Transcript_35257/g.77021 Transcript_35257/m.77021 type:complete len:310 (-) Transcript_35257:162-1091(-)
MLELGMSSHSRSTPAGSADLSSDVGRKKFGFGHEAIEDSNAYYEGYFKLYQRCGEGVLHNPDTGSKYVGQFLQDQFHGTGEHIWPDGSRYKGEWKFGLKHGRAEYTSAEGLQYIGQWEEGRRHGQGKQTYANFDRYEGWWFRGFCSGFGTYYFADGSKYEGIWAHGRYDGPGTLYNEDGSCEKRSYSDGMLMKREVLPPNARRRLSTLKRGSVLGSVHDTSKFRLSQTRDDMHRPALMPGQQISRYLIRREYEGLDLTAPPLKPKTTPALQSELDTEGQDLEPPRPTLPMIIVQKTPRTPQTARRPSIA